MSCKKQKTDGVAKLCPFIFKIQNPAGLRFDVISGADAGCTHFDSFDGTALIDFDILQIDFKLAFDIFHNVHTDTAGFFGETLAGDATAVAFGFAADGADLAHFIDLIIVNSQYLQKNMVAECCMKAK